MDYVGENSIKKLSSLIKEDIATKQDKITAEGLLQGDGNGNITVMNHIQSRRTTKSIANSSAEIPFDGEIVVVRDGAKPYDTTIRVGDGTTQLKSLKEIGKEYKEATSSSSGLMSFTDKSKLDGIEEGANKTIIDSTLSSTSENPVQNKSINEALEAKLSLSGGTMVGALVTKGIKLTENVDYGATLPSNPETNQLFFQTVGSNFVLDNVYPVGSIYMSVNASNPETLFGGTWEQIQGRFLLGMNNVYPAGSQGGEATHTLTESEMPSHRGHLSSGIVDNAPYEKGNYKGFLNSDKMTAYGDIGRGWNVYSGNEMHPASEAVGGGQAHNNMPPYLSVYIWKRIA